MRLVLLCALLVALVSLGAVPADAQGNCDQFNFVPSRLVPGSTARVIYNNDGIGVVFRDSPGREQSGSRVIRALPEGTVLSIVRGPQCFDGNIWWEIELPTGETGWLSEGNATEYFVEPYTISVYVFEPDGNNPRQLNRWRIDINGNIKSRDTLLVPGGDAIAASEIWQEADINAANEALLNRRQSCPEVLNGTAWESVNNAEDVLVPEGDFEYYPSPDGGKIFLIRHRTLRIPACGNAPGDYYGISTVHLLSTRNVTDLFPFAQHSGARSKESCFSPTVSNVAWQTQLSDIEWSPDSDTVAFTARYLDDDDGGRPCAFYYTFIIDVFSGNITSVAEARRPGWGEGGTRLYYFTQDTDSGYNILDTDFWQLSNGDVSQISIPDGAQPMPEVFDSTGVILPWTEEGRKVLMCTGPIGCPGVYSYDVVELQSSPVVESPDIFQPFQVRSVHYVAGSTRILWLTQEGAAYIQALQGIDAGNFGPVRLEPGLTVEDLWIMPGGIYAVLKLSSGNFALLNTINRDLTDLGVLHERTAEPEETATATPEETPTSDE
jgi:hypothetical protein